MACPSVFPTKKSVFMVTTWIALHHPGQDGWMALHHSQSVLLVCSATPWVPPAEVGAARGGRKLWWDDSHVHQQKQNVISIGKYFKVFQPFKMKQNLSLQTVSSSHCSSSTCLFQGKQIHFDLKWLKLIPAQNQPFPTTHSELGEDLVVIKNLLTVFIPASPNKVSSMFCMMDIAAFHPVLGDAWVIFSACSLR